MPQPDPHAAADLLPCECHGDDLAPYCPRHTPLSGESEPSAATGRWKVTLHEGWTVSYRWRWWSRRKFACGNVAHGEAEPTAQYLRDIGAFSVRMERTTDV